MVPWLSRSLSAPAFCWRLERRDGVTIGLTSHDRDLVLAGLLYRAAPGMVPSAIEQSASLDTDTVDLSGVVTSSALNEIDLSAGRWDGARLTLFLVDWEQPESSAVTLLRGTLGTVQLRDGQFEVGLNGHGSALEQPVSERTSPDCRAELGDRRCRIDLGGRSRLVQITGISGTEIACTPPIVPGSHSYGRLRWLDGANAGLEAFILGNQATSLTLAEPPPLPVAAGDRAEITEGCDRRFATCVSRFQNAANFRGEPHLPGNDLLTRYAVQ